MPLRPATLTENENPPLTTGVWTHVSLVESGGLSVEGLDEVRALTGGIERVVEARQGHGAADAGGHGQTRESIQGVVSPRMFHDDGIPVGGEIPDKVIGAGGVFAGIRQARDMGIHHVRQPPSASSS